MTESTTREPAKQRPNPLLSVLVAASFAAGGCAGNRMSFQPPLDAGYRVQIERVDEIMPKVPQIYFQAGEITPESSLDPWQTYCVLELSAGDSGAVEAGEFEIAAVSLGYRASEYPYYGIQRGDTLIGFGLIGHRAAADYPWQHEGPPSYVLYRVEMTLGPPGPRSLTCLRKRDVRGPFYPGLDEMREALGDRISIEAPGS